jgi:hypothetical protein
MAKKRVKRGYFSKVSTGEIPVFTSAVDFLNRSGTGLPDRFQLCSVDYSFRFIFQRIITLYEKKVLCYWLIVSSSAFLN